jgi:hypothetical protein
VRTTRDHRTVVIEREKPVDAKVAVGILHSRDIIVAQIPKAVESHLSYDSMGAMILTRIQDLPTSLPSGTWCTLSYVTVRQLLGVIEQYRSFRQVPDCRI